MDLIFRAENESFDFWEQLENLGSKNVKFRDIFSLLWRNRGTRDGEKIPATRRSSLSRLRDNREKNKREIWHFWKCHFWNWQEITRYLIKENENFDFLVIKSWQWLKLKFRDFSSSSMNGSVALDCWMVHDVNKNCFFWFHPDHLCRWFHRWSLWVRTNS